MQSNLLLVDTVRTRSRSGRNGAVSTKREAFATENDIV